MGSSQAHSIAKKRKSPEGGLGIERRASPFDRRHQQNDLTPSSSPASSEASARLTGSTSVNTYNGVLDADEAGFIFCRVVSSSEIAKQIARH